MLTTLLFTLPPLLDIRGVRPVLIFRRAVEDADDPFVAGVIRKLRKNVVQIGAAVLILVGLTAIATTLSDSATVGRYFSIGLVSVLAVLLLASAGVLALLRVVLRRSGFSLPSSLRHGLANLYRPGNPSAALLAALGLGVMQIMTVYLVQQAVVHELHMSSAPDLPNVFLIDITSEEIAGVRALLKGQAEVTATPEFLPVVSSRILQIDGVEATKAKIKNFPKRMLQSISLTWADVPPPGTTPVEGKWWTAAQAADAGKHPLVAVNQPQAERLGLHVGSTVTFAAQDTQFTATVAAITKSDGQHAFSRAEFTLPPGALAGLPVVWYGGVHADPQRVDLAAAGALRGVPDGDGDQRGAGARDDTAGGGADHVRGAVSGGVFDLCGGGDPGELDCGDAVPAGARGGGAEDAGGDAGEDCDDLFDRVCGAGSGGGGGGGGVCEPDCGGDPEEADGGVPVPLGVGAAGAAGDGAADGGDGVGGELSGAGAEAARGFAGRVGGSREIWQEHFTLSR